MSAKDTAVHRASVLIKMGTEDWELVPLPRSFTEHHTEPGCDGVGSSTYAVHLSCPTQAPQATSPHCPTVPLWAGLLL